MYVILWEYQVRQEHLAEFESIYGANGAWAELFRKGEGYLGTELLHDQGNLRRFVTIDRWISASAYEKFKIEWREEYDRLDAQCSDLTERESLLGTFSSVPTGG